MYFDKNKKYVFVDISIYKSRPFALFEVNNTIDDGRYKLQSNL